MKPLKPEVIAAFRRYDLDNLLSRYQKSMDLIDLSRSSYIPDYLDGCFWDLEREGDEYEQPIRDALLSPDPMRVIEAFNEAHSPVNPYVIEDDPTGIRVVTFNDLIEVHAQGMYGRIEFWVSKLMIDGLVEKTEEYIIWMT